jgi:hypothetical protein
LWRQAREQIAGRPAPAAGEKRRRREDGESGFQKLAAKFLRRLQARKRAQFVTAARTRLRRVRIVRLSRAAWGASDAHLQTTLNLFEQPGSGASTVANNNSRATHSYHQPSENNVSLGL